MAWYNNNFVYKRSVTIPHSNVSGGSDLTDFPLGLIWANADMKTTGNGGNIQNANGYDIVPINSAENAPLDFEIEMYDGSAGTIIFWVRVPTLSHSVDTTFYLYYDNSTISTSQQNINAVWDSNYRAVYHLKETSGTAGSIFDSTSNANSCNPYTTYDSVLGNIGTSSGFIDGAQSFNGTTRAIARLNTSSLDVTGQNLTVSAWIQRPASNSVGTIVYHGQPGVGGYVLNVGATSLNEFKVTKYGQADISIGAMPADTNWHYVVLTGSSSGTLVYVDGIQSGSSGNNDPWKTAASNFLIGANDPGDPSLAFWPGKADETRVSASTRSAGWIATEYANQFDPNSFFTVGAAQTNTTASSVFPQGNHRSIGRIR